MGTMNIREIAIEFVDLWDDMETPEINTLLAENINLDLLEFFSAYAERFAKRIPGNHCAGQLRGQLPNLLIVGYIIRILEERLPCGK